MKKYLSPLYALPVASLALSLALIVSIFAHMNAVRSGQEVLIPARGYDPRAILLGHYVSLRPDTAIDITGDLADKIQTELAPGKHNYGSETMWITLDASHSDWAIKDITHARPEKSALAMHVSMGFYRNQEKDSLTYTVTPDLEIDRYYANQTQALEIESKLRDGEDVMLIVSIGKDGKPRLKGLQIDGEREIMRWW
jgi:uncharacterized membrane-anchored protein